MSLIKQFIYDSEMSQCLSVSNLTYEELILLQQIMIDVYEHGIESGHALYDKEDFDSLYEKIMCS
jgi:hypothetical protein